MHLKHLIIYDDLDNSDEEYNERVRGITNHYIWDPDGFDLITTNNLSNTLKELADKVVEENKWVLINTTGHAVHTNPADFYNLAVKKCEEANSPLMGHVLHNPAHDYFPYPYLHNQCLVLDLLVWKEVGCPEFEWVNIVDDRLNNLVRSVENFHDEYTPYWVGPDKTDEIVNLEHREFGSVVIEKLAEAGHRIINFDDELRRQKWHLYPNHEYEILNNFFKTGEIDKESNLYKSAIRDVLWQKESLSKMVYILNTEEIVNDDTSNVKTPIDHYIVVAGGFKPALLAHKFGYHANTKITVMDISDAGINFQKYMRENWNGDLVSYPQRIIEFSNVYPDYDLAWRSWNSMESEINKFLEEMNLTLDEFQHAWQEYCNIECEYVKTDFLTDPSKLIEAVNTGENKNFFVWISNAFDMSWTVFLLGRNNALAKFDSLLKNFEESKNNITIEAQTQYKTYNY
jgi:hypothetical protein